ncbi:MAG TPA: BglG family transcription antiterminator [Clostridiaceae bacterium]|nr:BglG family transcription antiterminator [Clostridiaceae bacterium]
MYITNRERSIIEILLKSQHLFISSNSIARDLRVSTRTVQREIKLLEDTLVKFRLELEKKAGEGIRIAGKHEDILRLREEISTYSEFELERSERSLVIFHELMNSEYPVKTDTLARELGISGKTLTQDLEYFEEKIRNTRLNLIRKRGYGVELKGREKDKRITYVNMVMQRLEQSALFSVKEGEFISFDSKEKIYGIMDPTELSELERIILEETERLPYRLTDLAVFEILLYVNLAVERIKGHRIIEKPSGKEMDTPEDRTADAIYARIESNFNIMVPRDEVSFLASNLRSAKRTRLFDLEGDIELSSLASELIDDVSRVTGYYFGKDKKFLDALVSHLEPLFNRINEGIFVSNPIKQEIKENYAVLYNSLGNILRDRFPSFDFSEDEIGFLTLHFAAAVTEFKEVPKVTTLVVCTSGIATSRMLTKRLLNKFPQLTIIEQGSLRDLHKQDIDSFDLIISTVGIYDAEFDYIQVNPMLTHDDEEKLEKVINGKLMSSTRRRLEPDTKVKKDDNLLRDLDILEESNRIIREILTDFKAQDMDEEDLQEILGHIERDIEPLGLVPEAGMVKGMLLEKDATAGSGIPGSGITLLHGRDKEIRRILFRVYRNGKKIRVKGMDGEQMESGTFLFLIAPEVLSETELELLSTISVALLEEENRRIYETAEEKEMSGVLEKNLKTAYMEIINRLWR